MGIHTTIQMEAQLVNMVIHPIILMVHPLAHMAILHMVQMVVHLINMVILHIVLMEAVLVNMAIHTTIQMVVHLVNMVIHYIILIILQSTMAGKQQVFNYILDIIASYGAIIFLGNKLTL